MENADAHAAEPGGIVRRQCLEPLGLSVTGTASGLGVTRQALSRLVNGRTGNSVDMTVRLSKEFGSSPETWLGMQMAYELWQGRQGAFPVLKQMARKLRRMVAGQH